MTQPNVRLGFLALMILPLGGSGKADLPQTGQPEIQRLIRKLGSENFQEREAASRDLAAIGEPARSALRSARDSSDLEVRRRAARLVELLVDADAAREAVALQGVWVLKMTEYLGEKAEQDPVEDELEKLRARHRTPVEELEVVEDLSQRRTTLAFNNNSFEFRLMSIQYPGFHTVKGTYLLDVERSPMVMERSWEEQGIREETHVSYSTYSLQGNTLRMCVSLSNDRRRLPTKLETADDEDIVLLTFKREKQ
jgi:hypothetical protein